MRKTSKLLALALLGAVTLSACQSDNARSERVRAATLNEVGSAKLADDNLKVLLDKIDKGVMAELRRLGEKLSLDNRIAWQVSDKETALYMQGENFTSFIAATDKLKAEQETDYLTAYNLYDRGIRYSEGYKKLSLQADAELSVARETSKAAFGAAISAARESWQAYATSVKPAPSGEATPAPTPTPANPVIAAIAGSLSELKHTTPAPTHTPTPHDLPPHTPHPSPTATPNPHHSTHHTHTPPGHHNTNHK